MSATAAPEATPETEPGHDPHGHDHDGPHWAHHFESWKQQFDAGKLGMWAFLVQEILFFSGLFCAYAVYRMLHPEIFEYADEFLSTAHGFFNTLVLLFSSLTMAWGVRAAMLGQNELLKFLIGTTIFCAALFLGVKAYEYTEKWHAKLLWGGTYSGRTTGSPESWVKVDATGTLDMTEVMARTEASLGVMEVALWAAMIVSLGMFVLGRYGTSRSFDLIASGFITGLSGLGTLLFFADGVSMSASVAAVMVGTFLVSFTFLCVRAFCSELATATVCSVWTTTAVAMIFGSWISVYMHHALHDGEHGAHHGESHAAAHDDGHTDGHHDEDGHHAGDGHGPLEGAHADNDDSPEVGDGVALGGAARANMTDMPTGVGEVTGEDEDLGEPEGVPEPDQRPLRLGIFFGIYYVMTGLHAVHIVAGIVALTWILCRAVLGHFTPEHFGPVDFVGLYWHIVDLVWIYLFPLLYLIG